jgi:proprotein convertase subtilisin/kexin type 5
VNGQCTSCYGGFVLIQGKCVAQSSQNVDPNCAKFDTQGICVQCSQGAYFSNGVCMLADANCKTFNNVNGQCTSCYGGFVLIQGKCVAQSSQNVDPNCAKFDTQGNCVQCSQGAYFSNGVCTLVDANCKTFNNVNGQCTSCYGGFVLIQGKCVAQSSQNVDPNCAKFDTQGICVQCSQGAYFSNGVCMLADANCKTFNNVNGQCTSCYGGFVLIQGKCVAQSSQNVDPNCAKFDTQGICVQCSQGAYFSNGVCTLVDANCKTFNNVNGQCTSCYGGFVLIQGKCVAQSSQNVDPNCAKFDTQGNCVQCSQGAYFSNGVCTLVDANCKTFNNVNGQCTSCYGGFVLIQGKCVAQSSQNVDPNCAKFDTQGNCVQCSQGAYFSNGVCTLVDANCKTFNNVNGQCTSCYGGFVLIQGKCVAQSSQNVDPNCAKFDTQGNCVQCSQGAYFSNGVCTLVDANCKTFNNVNGQCTSCYGGFVLIQGKCVAQSSQNVDPNCAKFDTQGICVQCSQGAYFSNGVCMLADANCKTFNNVNGQCTSCYGGFVLIQGKCVAQSSQNVDPNCAKFDTQGICVQCSQGAYFSNGVCTLVDANCKTFNNVNGQCTSCYGGFVLIQGKCVAQSSQNVDPNCAKFDTQGICVQCSQGAYFSNGVCTLVDANCKTFNNVNGQCTSCYGGFVLIQGKCVAQSSQNVDPNCAKFDTQGICVQCSQGAYFSNGVCTLVDANCKTFNNVNGQCTSCYGGFVLIQGKCVAQSSQNVDPNCAKFDTQGICVQCSQGAYFSNGVCTLVDANCKTFNNVNGQCTSCYGGFVLIQGKCVAQSSQNVDPNCAKFDTQGICVQCSQGAYFSNGVCTLVDANCKTFNNVNGQCTSCYGGFVLIQGKCVAQSSQNVDPNCAKFDTQGICVQCSQGAYFSNGVCTLVDANCKTFNNVNGQCTSCYGGFVLIQGKCVAQSSQNVDPNCAKFDTQGNCVQCSQGAYFSNGVCTLSRCSIARLLTISMVNVLLVMEVLF